GIPSVADWGSTEEMRKYSVEIKAKDGAGNTGSTTITITVQRDTDGDGIPDETDPDDDNDGIPDNRDQQPKTPDTTAPVISAGNATVTEKAPILPIVVSVTDDQDAGIVIDPNDVSGLPAGLTYNPVTSQIEGIPSVSDWGSTEEMRKYSVEIKAKDGAGNTGSTTITITVQRD
ncbi:Ig domain-containing protein, partial [Streptococcus porcinus]